MVQFVQEDVFTHITSLPELHSGAAARPSVPASLKSAAGRDAVTTRAAQLMIGRLQQQQHMQQVLNATPQLTPEAVAEAEEWAAKRRYAADANTCELVKQDLLEALQDFLRTYGYAWKQHIEEGEASLLWVMKVAWEVKVRRHSDQEFDIQRWSFRIQ